MSSEEDGAELMAAFKRGSGKKTRTRTPQREAKELAFLPGNFISDQSSEENGTATKQSPVVTRTMVAVRAPPVRNRDEYTYYAPKEAVGSIVREFTKKGILMYEIKLKSSITKQVSGCV